VIWDQTSPYITGKKADEDINFFAEYLHAFFELPLESGHPSLILYYNTEDNLLTTVVGSLEKITPLPEGTFMSNQSGQV
jgi:hypothetical protein